MILSTTWLDIWDQQKERSQTGSGQATCPFSEVFPKIEGQFPPHSRAFLALFINPVAPFCTTETGLAGTPPCQFRFNWAWSRDFKMVAGNTPPPILSTLPTPRETARLLITPSYGNLLWAHTVAVEYLACSAAIQILPAKEDTAQTLWCWCLLCITTPPFPNAPPPFPPFPPQSPVGKHAALESLKTQPATPTTLTCSSWPNPEKTIWDL